jgi:hypothetical protein
MAVLHASGPESADPPPTWTAWQLAAVFGLGLSFSIGVISRLEPLNGLQTLTGWEWPWRSLGTLRVALLLAGPFVLIAATVRHSEASGVSRPWRPLLALVLASFLLQVLGVLADPRGLAVIGQVVAHRGITGYFTDATQITDLHEWLGRFHEIRLELHSRTHPPGPIVFYHAFVRVLGLEWGARLAGCAVGLVASLGTAVVYLVAGLWTSDRRTRLLAAAWYGSIPALVVFFPQLDQAYPIISLLMIWFWVRALAGLPRHAALLGVTLFVASLLAYNLLTVGAFLVYWGAYRLWREGGSRSAWTTLLRSGGIALGIAVVLHVLLWATTGYEAVASFRLALAVHHLVAAPLLERSYLTFVLLDPCDFLLGAGVIALPILLFHLRARIAPGEFPRPDLALTLVGLATILTIDLTGLLRGETARVWLFLQPLLAIPVALELSRVRLPWRIAILALQGWIVVCVKANMSFIDP